MKKKSEEKKLKICFKFDKIFYNVLSSLFVFLYNKSFMVLSSIIVYPICYGSIYCQKKMFINALAQYNNSHGITTHSPNLYGVLTNFYYNSIIKYPLYVMVVPQVCYIHNKSYGSLGLVYSFISSSFSLHILSQVLQLRLPHPI